MISPNLRQELSRRFGEGQVVIDEATLAPFLTDSRGVLQGKALALLRPRTTEELASMVSFMTEQGIGIVPQGGNSGRVGGATPSPSGDEVLMSVARLNHIRQIDKEAYNMVAEAGLTIAAIQQAALAENRLFPVSFGAEGTAQLGGAIATNAGGLNVIRYGSMRSQILGLEVVLADGQIYHGLKTLIKDNSGYDLKQLFIGSEGTLGIISAASLRLQPCPPYRQTLQLSLTCPTQVKDVFSATREWAGSDLGAFEIMAPACLALVRKYWPEFRFPLAQSGAEDWQLLIELIGNQAPQLSLEDFLNELYQQGWLTDATIAHNLAQEKTIWQLREMIVEAQRLEGNAIKHDIAVPVGEVWQFYELAAARLQSLQAGLGLLAFGHVGDGNWHFNILKPADLSQEQFAKLGPSLSELVHQTAVELGGTISAEHGIGQVKRAALRQAKSPLEIKMMTTIKQGLDPKGLMNPGKLL